MFRTKDLFVSNIGAMNAINAGALDFLPKEHTHASFLIVFPALYIIVPQYATVFSFSM